MCIHIYVYVIYMYIRINIYIYIYTYIFKYAFTDLSRRCAISSFAVSWPRCTRPDHPISQGEVKLVPKGGKRNSFNGQGQVGARHGEEEGSNLAVQDPGPLAPLQHVSIRDDTSYIYAYMYMYMMMIAFIISLGEIM